MKRVLLFTLLLSAPAQAVETITYVCSNSKAVASSLPESEGRSLEAQSEFSVFRVRTHKRDSQSGVRVIQCFPRGGVENGGFLLVFR